MLQHVTQHCTRFTVPRAGAPRWDDESAHRGAYAENPELYALAAVVPGARPEQMVRILFTLLSSSRGSMVAEQRSTLDRVTSLLASSMPADDVLRCFLALRRVRANHKHTQRTMVAYVLNHEALPSMLAARRRAVRDVLEHALGRDVMRGSVRWLQKDQSDAPYVRRNLWCHYHGNNREAVAAQLLTLYAGGALVVADGGQDYRAVHVPLEDPDLTRPKTVTATNRGDAAATLVHMYRGGSNAELQSGLTRYVKRAASKLPRIRGKVAFVLDASASMRGYGGREFCAISQAVALQLVVAECAERFELVVVGGDGEPPAPSGATDLAMGLVDALATEPDLVLIATDGYENQADGDLARVVATLPRLNINTPVVVCHCKFTWKDAMALRRFAGSVSQLEFWHESEFETLVMSALSLCKTRSRETELTSHLHTRLERAQTHGKSWFPS